MERSDDHPSFGLRTGGLVDTRVVEGGALLSPSRWNSGCRTVAALVVWGGDLQLDALLLQPIVSTVRYRLWRRSSVLYADSSTTAVRVVAVSPGGVDLVLRRRSRGGVGDSDITVTGGGSAVTQ